MEVISLFIESVVQESDEKILKYEEALEKKKVENKKKKKKEEIEMFKEVENCIEKDKIEELIKCLPFAFNLS